MWEKVTDWLRSHWSKDTHVGKEPLSTPYRKYEKSSVLSIGDSWTHGNGEGTNASDTPKTPAPLPFRKVGWRGEAKPMDSKTPPMTDRELREQHIFVLKSFRVLTDDAQEQKQLLGSMYSFLHNFRQEHTVAVKKNKRLRWWNLTLITIILILLLVISFPTFMTYYMVLRSYFAG